MPREYLRVHFLQEMACLSAPNLRKILRSMKIDGLFGSAVLLFGVAQINCAVYVSRQLNKPVLGTPDGIFRKERENG
ncbi:MAG: hypothetical protein ACYSSO_15165 [Planctomycetota bacterium]